MRSRAFRFFLVLIVLILLAAGYFWAALTWSYSAGERAGWVQKLSKKGWLCKTWEGEMALVSMPGTSQETFHFTVRDDGVAQKINDIVGRRVSLTYEEKVGLPTSCFGETRHYVTGVRVVKDIPLAPGIVVPTEPEAESQPAPPVQQDPPAEEPGPLPGPPSP